jgi:hypothetical protein
MIALIVVVIGATALIAGLLLYVIIKIDNMKFQEFEEAINAKLDALAQAIADETAQVTAAIQELRDIIEDGSGTPEKYLAILDRVDAKIVQVNAIFEPEEEEEDPGDDDGDI